VWVSSSALGQERGPTGEGLDVGGGKKDFFTRGGGWCSEGKKKRLLRVPGKKRANLRPGRRCTGEGLGKFRSYKGAQKNLPAEERLEK